MSLCVAIHLQVICVNKNDVNGSLYTKLYYEETESFCILTLMNGILLLLSP